MSAGPSIRAPSSDRFKVGSCRGLGYALHEEISIGANGRIRQASLETYRVPLAQDVVPVEISLYEGAPSVGPLGTKGAGEVPILNVAAAVACAVANATGRRVQEIPLTPPRVPRTAAGKKRYARAFSHSPAVARQRASGIAADGAGLGEAMKRPRSDHKKFRYQRPIFRVLQLLAAAQKIGRSCSSGLKRRFNGFRSPGFGRSRCQRPVRGSESLVRRHLVGAAGTHHRTDRPQRRRKNHTHQRP